MTTDECAELRFLLQADFDGELDVAGTAALAAHLAQCPDCAAEQAAMAALSRRLRSDVPYHAAPDALHQRIAAAVAASATAPPPAPAPAPPRIRRPAWLPRPGRWMERAFAFGGGAAVAAALVLLLVLPPGGGEMADSVVASHIRALQPGHLMDVVSTDQHTVKPWFDGRLDYAPPVKDLAAQGFPLVGGRLDVLAGRPVAALAYRRALHVIDLYVWPSAGRADAVPAGGTLNGYNFLRWTQDGMALWVVSDLNRAELAAFVERWRAMP